MLPFLKTGLSGLFFSNAEEFRFELHILNCNLYSCKYELQNANFQSSPVFGFGFMVCRPLPGGQKLRFCQNTLI